MCIVFKKLVIFSLILIVISSTFYSLDVKASCNHSWSPYTFYDSYLEPPSSMGKCFKRVTVSVRTCYKCGDVGFKTIKKQLSHKFVNGLCVRCGCLAMHIVQLMPKVIR